MLYSHVAQCHVPNCGWVEEWTNDPAATAAAVWHVHDEHPRVWLDIVGERPPVDPKPETLGDRISAVPVKEDYL